jgi:hypothetical protein
MDKNELRRAVVAGLESAGETDLAARAGNPLSTMLGRVEAIPGGAVAVLVEAFPHTSASFYVGLVDGQAFYLTDSPDAFTGMLRASGLEVTDEHTAEAVARAYVETTRTFYTFTTVLDSADEIRWDPSRELTPELAAEVRQAVRPPATTAVGPGRYAVSLFVLRSPAIERRLLTVTTDGAVTEQAEDVFPDLPLPASL